MTEGVGKRIVDALKKQSEVEFVNKTITTVPDETVETVQPAVDFTETLTMEPEIFASENNFNAMPQQPVFTTVNPVQNNVYSTANDFNGLEVPPNVAVLRQLISQLPSGVSRQAGALVIKQTMEALGISMKSVLQEAQQLQENINISARECQNSILECKKQINTLEAQVQKYQKQSASLNDIVSLFLQIN